MQKTTAFANGIFCAFCNLVSRRGMLLKKILLCYMALYITAGHVLAAGQHARQNIEEIKVTITVQNEPLKSALQKLQTASGIIIFFPSARVEPYQHVTLPQASRTVAETLRLLLKDTDLDFQLNNGKIIISQKKTDGSPANEAVDKVITGVVKDEANLPLQGVTVRSRLNRAINAVTDQNGQFQITVESDKDYLVFSSVGFASQEIAVSGKSSVEVRLQLAAGSLDEVVVVGYGTTTRRDNTGAVSSITARDISKQTVDNPLVALQGRIAGMQITQDNGLPGASVRVSIRGAYNGLSSAGFLPLYVIDGVPFTLFNGAVPATDNLNAYGTSGANGGVSPFSLIAPEDIERIDILKDADATAIYGSRGSNGVVLITTKKGKQGKTGYSFNVNTGTKKVMHFIPMMNTPEYLAMRTAAFANAGVAPTNSNAPDLKVWDQNAYTDWQKWAIGGTAHTVNASASVSGGTAQNTFLLTTEYRHESTVYPGDFDATTFSGRLNAGHKSTDGRFTAEVATSYSYMGTFLPNTDITSLYNLPPNFPLYNADSSKNWTLTSPLAYLAKTTRGQTTNFITNVNLAYAILPGLRVKANLGYTFSRLKQQQINPASSQNPAGSTSSTLVYTDNDNNNYIIEPQAEYTRDIAKGKLLALVGTTFQQTKAAGVYLTGTGYSNEALIYSLSAAASVTTNYNNNSLYKYNAVFARLNYNWEDKYIVDGTFRRDGSSRFGANNRFGSFGAAGVSWIFTRENFLHWPALLSFGKLRASYGVTGNDQIPNYQYAALYTTVGSAYSYNGTSAIVPSNISNPNLHWESTQKLDLALELGFMQDRILVKADYYRNRTSDPLNYVYVPGQSGTSSYLGNLDAVVITKGWELELNTTNIATKALRWNTAINVTIPRNKLASFNDLANSSYKNTYIIGQPTTITQLYHYTGPNATTGLPTFMDKSGDGNIAYADDRYVARYGHPYFGGITNSISYKGFQLDFTFQYTHRYGYKNGTLVTNFNPYGYTYGNQSDAVVNRWPADNAFFPAASVTGNAAYSTLTSSDYNWGDASFVKFKSASLYYTLPKRLLKYVKANVYVQGQNLFVWAKQKYTFDPETTVPGTGSALGTGQYLALPQLRTLVVGLNCSF